MKLYFKDRKNRERLLGEPSTKKEIWDIINRFMDEHNYTCYYSRIWAEPDGRLWIDVGSWSEFFIIEGISFEEYVNE